MVLTRREFLAATAVAGTAIVLPVQAAIVEPVVKPVEVTEHLTFGKLYQVQGDCTITRQKLCYPGDWFLNGKSLGQHIRVTVLNWRMWYQRYVNHEPMVTESTMTARMWHREESNIRRHYEYLLQITPLTGDNGKFDREPSYNTHIGQWHTCRKFFPDHDGWERHNANLWRGCVLSSLPFCHDDGRPANWWWAHTNVLLIPRPWGSLRILRNIENQLWIGEQFNVGYETFDPPFRFEVLRVRDVKRPQYYQDYEHHIDIFGRGEARYPSVERLSVGRYLMNRDLTVERV